MNEKERTQWEQMEKQGVWFHLLQVAVITAVAFLVTDALVGSGYTLLLKQGNWDKYIHQVDWIKLLRQGFIVGLVMGWLSWRRLKKAFGQKQS